jgi:hypothetical protein
MSVELVQQRKSYDSKSRKQTLLWVEPTTFSVVQFFCNASTTFVIK